MGLGRGRAHSPRVEMVFVSEQRQEMRSEPTLELNIVLPAQQVYMDLFLNKLQRVNGHKRREQVANNMLMKMKSV